MRYLVVVLVLIPALTFAGQKGKYLVNCEDISGGQCKKECSEGEKAVKKIEIGEGDQKGIIAGVDCSSAGKGFVCCVEKKKIKE